MTPDENAARRRAAVGTREVVRASTRTITPPPPLTREPSKPSYRRPPVEPRSTGRTALWCSFGVLIFVALWVIYVAPVVALVGLFFGVPILCVLSGVMGGGGGGGEGYSVSYSSDPTTWSPQQVQHAVRQAHASAPFVVDNGVPAWAARNGATGMSQGVPTFRPGSQHIVTPQFHPSTGQGNGFRTYQDQGHGARHYGGSYTQGGTYYYDPNGKATVVDWRR